MKSTIETLPPKVKALLADLYELDAYQALKKLLEAERTQLALWLVDIQADDVKMISRYQGRIEALKLLHKAIQENYKVERDKENQKP